MHPLSPLVRAVVAARRRAVGRIDPVAEQVRQLEQLIDRACDTAFGRAHDFPRLTGVADFQAAVPLRRYEDFWRDWWQPAFPMLVDVSWPGQIPYFALSSGTTTGVTKYLPVSREMVASNRRAGTDLLAWHLDARPRTRALAGTSLMLGGSTALEELAPGVLGGDLSGIAAAELPWYVRGQVEPRGDAALLADWEAKLARLTDLALRRRIRSLTGTASWLLILLERIAEGHRAAGRTGLPLPDLDLLVPGGVALAPYLPRLRRLLGDRVDVREVYPASEGFVAVQDGATGEGLRLVLDHGIFFEFVPVAEIDADRPTRHWVETIETGVDYAVVVSTCAGLWGYVLGDTVRFVSTLPPRLVVTGRLSWGLSIVGEHLIVEELDAAVAEAAGAVQRDVADYAVAGVLPPQGDTLAHHRFFVELEPAAGPDEMARFAAALDAALERLNADYAAHRTGGVGLDPPQVTAVAAGGFAGWMRARGKAGGQNKVPRVIHDAGLLASLEQAVAG